MKKYFTIMLLLLVVSGMGICIAADKLSLADNTLVTDDSMLRCLSRTGEKALVFTGNIGDAFTIYEDGVAVTTITLAAVAEKYEFNHVSSTYKVDWTPTATATTTLYCIGG